MAQRNNKQLWNIIKTVIKNENIYGTKKNEWSARKSQIAVKLYKDFGGTYTGKKTSNNLLTKWTKQNWTTKSGLPSSITGERYLPKKAIEKLTNEQYSKTSRVKRKAMKENKQYSKQPIEISQITKKYIK